MNPLFIAVALVVLFVVVNLMLRARERGPTLETMSTGSLETDIANLLGMGKKLEAIRLYRSQTGAGLAQAQMAIEKFATSGELPTVAPPQSSEELEAEVAELIACGESARAIILVRQRTGLSLAEAKRAIETIAARSAQPGQQPPSR
jgi:ribosomal protein L7/L12